ncbi:PadR family transcriptional regulator [Micromonospora sp. NPDC049523]|uniref:PadR family transcriptional regulator n=1 Tax=Micromonospora sp. NPDC049523 TaxID=3155921 RepID=UPI00341E709C
MEMREATYFILAALQGEPRHGYAIMKFAIDSSGGRVKLSTGTLYTALDRLNTAGLIETDRQEVVDGRARRYYRLTDTGRSALLTEAARLAEMSRVVTDHAASADQPAAVEPSRTRRPGLTQVRPA